MATLFLQAMRLNATYDNKTAKDVLTKELEVLCDDMGWVTEIDLRKWPKIREFQEAIEVKPHGPIKPGSHLSKSIFRMQILNIFKYAHMEECGHTLWNTTYEDIEQAMSDDDIGGTAPSSSLPVPTLKIFSGDKNDWDEWKHDTEADFGREGLTPFLKDEKYCKKAKNKKDAMQCYWTLRSAIAKGTAVHVVQTLENKGIKDPAKLYKALYDEFEGSDLTQKKGIKALMTLLELRLEPHMDPYEFITNVKTAYAEIVKEKNPIANHSDSLSAIVLKMLVDDQWDAVRCKILRQPKWTFDEIMECLKREAKVRSQANDDDGEIQAQRSTARMPPEKLKYDAKKSVHFDGSKKGAYIPPFPSSWRAGLGEQIYGFMCKWRKAVIHNVHSII